MFPSVILNNNVSNFSCEACDLGKHHRFSFVLSNNKNSLPFTLIHSIVWGPSCAVFEMSSLVC